MVLSCPGVESTRYGHDHPVYPSPGADLAQQLREAVTRIHGTYRPAAPTETDDEAVDSIPADPNVKYFSYTVVENETYFRENSVMVRPKLNATATARVKGMVKLRDCVQQLIDLQMRPDTPDSGIKAKQAVPQITTIPRPRKLVFSAVASVGAGRSPPGTSASNFTQ